MRRWGASMFVAVIVMLPSCDESSGLIGTPCVPAQENDPTFLGFDPQEFTFEATAVDQAQPNTIVCLVNHFRGRTTCPYGQDTTGTQLPQVDGAWGGPFPAGTGPCSTPSGDAVVGDTSSDPIDGAQVHPQCVDRRPAVAVIWSCECADGNGRPADGMCSCPSGTTCANLEPNSDGFESQFYCLPIGTEYAMGFYCNQPCDPSVTTCP